jgi:hypothetical protein
MPSHVYTSTITNHWLKSYLKICVIADSLNKEHFNNEQVINLFRNPIFLGSEDTTVEIS